MRESTLRHCLSLLLVAALAAAGARAGEPKLEVRVPAGPMEAALLELGRQTGLSILFARSVVSGVHTPGVHGNLTPSAALTRLLAGTPLTFELVQGEIAAIRLRPADTAASAQSTPAAMPARPQERYLPPPLIEEVRVTARPLTGSRIRRIDYSGTAAIDVIDLTEIAAAGVQSLGELLKTLPAVSGNSTSTQVTNGGDGTATVTLRGLPASNTLVLINGRRVNTDGLNGASVDLNSIPLPLVERVEILKDGASSIYGSDAIAGVVNVVTRDRLNGLAVSGFLGRASRRDLETTDIALLYGLSRARFEFTAGATFYEQNPVYSRDRRIARNADERSRGGIDKRSSATAPARVSVGGNALILQDGRTGDDAADFRIATDEDLFNFRSFTTAVVPSERYGAYAQGSVRTFAGRLFGELQYSASSARNTLAPAPIFTAFEARPLAVAADAAFNPFGVELTDVRRRLLENGPREQRNRSQSTRFVLGLESGNELFDWEAWVQGGRSEARESLGGVLDGDRLARAIGPADACTAPCVPLNLIGPAGSITPEQLAHVSASAHLDGQSDLLGASFVASTSLRDTPAGDVQLAAGLEYRYEALATRPDQRMQSNRIVGGNNAQPARGDRRVLEAFAELYVPLLRDLPGAASLDLELSGRISDYSDFGVTRNPRLGLAWRPLAPLLVRSTWGRGFRAPTLKQLHIGTSQSFEQISDPCATNAFASLPGCDGRADPTLTQQLVLVGGNPGLEAERSHTWTVGLVWTPASVPGAEFTVDYWRIRQTNVVDTSAQFIVNRNARFGEFEGRVQRNADGNIARVLATELNIGKRELAGVDISASWHGHTRLGEFEVTTNAAHIARYVDRMNPETPPRDQAGTFSDDASSGNGALPGWKTNFGVDWRRQRWGATWNLRYVAALREVVPLIGNIRTIESWMTHDVQARYLLLADSDGIISLGVNNLFDIDPPFAAAAFNDGFDARTYEIAGRFAYLRFSALF